MGVHTPVILCSRVFVLLLIVTHHCLSLATAVLIVTCMYLRAAEVIGNGDLSKHRYGRHHMFMK